MVVKRYFSSLHFVLFLAFVVKILVAASGCYRFIPR
jgi:hypothetical protein